MKNSFKKYLVYIDDCRDVFRIAVPAKSKKEAEEYVYGTGEIIAVKEVTEEYPISNTKVHDALFAAGFGTIERDFIIRALSFTGITD